MITKNKLIIIGNNPFAEIANEYFTHDSDYDVVAFSIEKKFMVGQVFLRKFLISFDELEDFCDPQKHSIFVALGYGHMNQDRTRLYLEAKSKGYGIASYISSKAFIWKNVKIGEHCFIFENNVIQSFVEIGNNVIIWSGNHIGHHTKIDNNCFISSHVVISGLCKIGKNCFFGVNSTVYNDLSIEDFCLVGATACITKDALPNKTYVGNPARKIKNVNKDF